MAKVASDGKSGPLNTAVVDELQGIRRARNPACVNPSDIGIPSRGPRLKTNERKYKRNGDENDGGSGGGGGGEGEEGVRQREGEIDRAAEG